MKKFVIAFMSAFIFLYALLGAFVIIVDPYYVFHMPFFNMEPIKTSDSHYVARGLIRNMDYDILVCGSSMCENMHTDYVDDVFGGTSIKVIQHGSHSKDLAASLKQAARSDKAEMIIMGLDLGIWKKPSDVYRIEDIPDYAVEAPSVLNSASYIFNIDSLKLCINLMKANKDGNLETMNTWWITDDELNSKNSVAQDWIQQKKNGAIDKINQKLAWENYDNLVEGIVACQDKGIKIKFFIPPYSLAEFSLCDYEADLKVEKEIWRELLQYDNVELYAIQFDTELIQHFERYRNVRHYNGLVCDMIIDDIAAGKFLLTTDNIDEQVELFKQFLDAYDWENLNIVLME